MREPSNYPPGVTGMEPEIVGERDRPLSAGAIGARIRMARLADGLTQGEVGVKAGLSVPHISDIERGRVHPALKTLQRLAGALDVPLGDLVAEPPSGNLRIAELEKALSELIAACVNGPPPRYFTALEKAQAVLSGEG